MNILVTGATGFVGHTLVKALFAEGHRLSVIVRKHSEKFPQSIEQIVVEDIGNLSSTVDEFHEVLATNDGGEQHAKLEVALKKTDVVVHTAGRAHVMKEQTTDPLKLFRRVNTEGTLALAHMAANAGVKRFIFLSTVKVNGETTTDREPFTEEDDCHPRDPYAISKWEAELGLVDISSNFSMDVVVIRPPLIYGPGVKGNFAALSKLVDKRLPIPLARVKNRRAMLALENLVSFISVCLTHPKAANEVFLLSDGKDISTAALVESIAHSKGKAVCLLPFPVWGIRGAASLVGKKAFSERLLGSLRVDISKARNLIGWQPVVTMQQQLDKEKITN